MTTFIVLFALCIAICSAETSRTLLLKQPDANEEHTSVKDQARGRMKRALPFLLRKLLDTTQLIVMGGKKIYGKMGGVDTAVEDFRNLRPKNVRSRGKYTWGNVGDKRVLLKQDGDHATIDIYPGKLKGSPRDREPISRITYIDQRRNRWDSDDGIENPLDL